MKRGVRNFNGTIVNLLSERNRRQWNEKGWNLIATDRHQREGEGVCWWNGLNRRRFGVLDQRRSLPMITESLLFLFSSPLCLDTLANGNTLAANLMSIVLLYKYSGSRQGPSPRFSSEHYNVCPDTSYRIVSVAEEESPSLSPKEPSPSERHHRRIVLPSS